MTIIYTNKGKAPLPKGWTLEEALTVLRESGHTVTNITTDGKAIVLPAA